MIMTQNQFLGLQARFGFRYASNRVPKTTDATRASYSRSIVERRQNGCRVCSAKVLAIARNSTAMRIPNVWRLLQIVLMTI